jgi:hypothetical protein
MVTENQVVDATAEALAAHGWRLKQKLTTKQQGVDIILERDGQELHVEAKGYTSSKEGTTRYGQPFSGGQLFDHTSKAIYKALKVASGGIDIAAVALPDDPKTKLLVGDVKVALDRMGVLVIWVDHEDGSTAELPEQLL